MEKLIWMKKILLDFAFVVLGVIIAPWGFINWSSLGFRIEPKFYVGNRDGSFFLIQAISK